MFGIFESVKRNQILDVAIPSVWVNCLLKSTTFFSFQVDYKEVSWETFLRK